MEGFAKDSKFVICMVGKPARGKVILKFTFKIHKI